VAFEPYRPYAIGVALVCMTSRTERFTRSSARACEPRTLCAVPQTRRIYKVMFWVVAAMVLIALVPLRGPIFLLGRNDETQFTGSGFCGSVGLTVFAPAHASDKTVTLSVPGMYCEMCPATVSKALKKVGGVEKVAASFETRTPSSLRRRQDKRRCSAQGHANAGIRRRSSSR